jgi:hypothetical protein
MKPTLTWLDLTAADRDKMRRVLDLFKEQGTVDELGLGTLRDHLSDALFPGTSSIQTRLRYYLFIPWSYQNLERRRVSSRDVRERARQAELALISPLLDSEDTDGVIGSTARAGLKRLPSEAYWAGLVRWGIFLPERSQGWYHAHFDAFSRPGEASARADDPGVVWSARRSWNARLPAPPDGFPYQASMALRLEEAQFLRDLVQARCAGTALASLAAADVGPAGDFWEEAALVDSAPTGVQTVVELARRFSLHVEGAPLLYNLMLAESRFSLKKDEADEDRIAGYRDEFGAWAAREAASSPFDVSSLWTFIASRGGRVAPRQRAFVELWTNQINAVGAGALLEDRTVRDAIRARELQLKTHRSRFANRGRLLSWSGRVGVGRMDFRWFRVRQLMTDLHAGLGVS